MSSLRFTTGLAAISSFAAISQLPLEKAALIVLTAIVAWYLTTCLIPKVAQFMLKKHIHGLDINKKGSKEGEKEIPQCVGFAAAVSFCMVGMVVVVILKYWSTSIILTTHLAVFVTIFGTIILGFADDMLDLPWRYKLLFPFFIVLPLVTVYQGSTHIDIIPPFSMVLGNTLQLSHLYLIYITLLGIYLTNTINIFAGINGLQVGQSMVTASAMLIYFFADSAIHNRYHRYQYSIYLLITFLATSIALMKFNAYPAKIFIGDTFCYFAGIVLAIAAIMGQIPIVCHWFLFPQLINFLYSIPQLFGFVKCPRHRLANYNVNTDKIEAISSNMNLLNLSLRILGPTNQGLVCFQLLVFQTMTSCIPIVYLLFTTSLR